MGCAPNRMALITSGHAGAVYFAAEIVSHDASSVTLAVPPGITAAVASLRCASSSSSPRPSACFVHTFFSLSKKQISLAVFFLNICFCYMVVAGFEWCALPPQPFQSGHSSRGLRTAAADLQPGRSTPQTSFTTRRASTGPARSTAGRVACPRRRWLRTWCPEPTRSAGTSPACRSGMDEQTGCLFVFLKIDV